MADLVLSILSATAILVLFKSFERFGIPVFQAIIINYAVAVALGVAVSQSTGGSGIEAMYKAPWIWFSAGLGACLLTMFFVIGASTQRAGISATTVAGRTSVVIPMLFSIFYYGEPVTPAKAAGILLALGALACTVVRPGNRSGSRAVWYLPLVLFTGLGLMDALVKFVQHEFVSGTDSAAFTGASFFFAFCTGLAVCLVRQVTLSVFMRLRVAAAGLLLGTANFGSIYFLINALNSGVFDSAVLFGINSISIVALSVFAGWVVFKERLTSLNWAGIGMAAAAIFLFVNA